MNCIKAKLISIKNRLVRIIQRRRPSTATRRTETPRRRIASLLRTRLRMRLQRRQREQRAASRDQEQRVDGSAPSVEDDTTNTRVVEVENPTTQPLTSTLSLNSLTSTSSITSTTFSHSSFDEDDYVDDSGLSLVYFYSEREEDEDDGITTENSLRESGCDADISSLDDTLSSSKNDEIDEADLEEDLTGLEVSATVVEHRTTSFSGAVALLGESSSEEDPTGDRDQERASVVEDGELHQTNLSGDNVFQWWEDQLHSAVQQCTTRDDDAESETSSMAELRSICGDDDREPTPLSLPDTTDPSYFDINQRQCDQRDQDLNHHNHNQQHNLISETEVGCHGHNTNQLHAAPEEDLTGLEVSVAEIKLTTSSFGGAVTLLGESSSEEDPTGDRDQERGLGGDDRELHQTNLSGDNVFQWWEDQLHSAVQQCTSRDEDAESETSSMAELRSICGDDDREPTPLPTLPSLPDTIDPSYFDSNLGQCDPRNQDLNHHHHLQQQLNATNLTTEVGVGAGYDGHSTSQYQSNAQQYHHVPGSAFSGIGCDPRVGQFVELGRQSTSHSPGLSGHQYNSVYNPGQQKQCPRGSHFVSRPQHHLSSGQMPQQAPQQHQGLVQPTGLPDQLYNSVWNFRQYEQSLREAAVRQAVPATIYPDMVHSIPPLHSDAKSQSTCGIMQPTGLPDQSIWNYEPSLAAMVQTLPATLYAHPDTVRSTAPPNSDAAPQSTCGLVQPTGLPDKSIWNYEPSLIAMAQTVPATSCAYPDAVHSTAPLHSNAASQSTHGLAEPTGLPDQPIWNYEQSLAAMAQTLSATSYAHPDTVRSTAQPHSDAAPQSTCGLVQPTGLPDQSIWNYEPSLVAMAQTVPATSCGYPDTVPSTALPHSDAASQQTYGLAEPTGVPDPWYCSLWNSGYQQHTQRAAMRQLSLASVIVPNSPQVPVQSAALPHSTARLQNFPQDVPKLVTDQQIPLSSRKRKPTSLSLSLGETDALISPHSPPSSPLPPPPVPAPSTAERKWEEYIANRSSSAEYFLYPPFTAEQEEWIVRVNHPFKDYVRQTWQEQVHSSIEESLGLRVT